MRDGNSEPGTARRPATGNGNGTVTGWVIETVVSPFHCLYQDALHFHTQSKLCLARSESEASRLARAALLLYVAGAEALVHQAAAELGRPDLAALVADPGRPLPLADAWRLLPAIAAEGHAGPFDPEIPPWPQFAELLALRTSWAYPGPAPERRAYYRSAHRDSAYEPLEPHQAPPGLTISARPPVLPENRPPPRPLRAPPPTPRHRPGHP